MLIRFFFVVAVLLMCGAAAAQNYPSKPVRLVVGFAPGGGQDSLARTVAQKLSIAFNQQFVVENRSGAGGTIGADLVAKSPPDGYTLLFAGVASHAINPNLQKNLPYDPLRDFEAASLLATAPMMVAVHPSLPAQTVQQLVALARAKPGEISYASSGLGSSAHLTGALFMSLSRTNLLHIPYKGVSQGLIDVLSGQVLVIFNAAAALLPHMQAGKLRVLGISSVNRIASLANVPTIAESGVPGYQAGSWYGIAAPAGTPRPIIDRLSREAATFMKAPELVARLNAEAIIAIGSTPEEFTAHIKDELARLGKVIREARITLE